MEPQYTEYLDSLGLALYVLKDIGWTVYPPSASNHAPVMTAIGAQSTNEDTAKNIPLAATDADGDSLTFSVSASCATSLTCAISGTTLTVTPAANYHGSGSITVSVSDGNGGSDSDTFTLTVNSVNDAPVFGSISAQSTNEDTAKVVSLAGSATDVDGDGLTYSVSSCPSNISCSLSGTSLTLTPDANFNGSRTVGVGVSDGNGGSASTTFSLTVNAVNDAPVFSSISAQSTNEDTAKVVSLAGTATDVDGDSLTYSVSSCPSNISCSLSGTSLTLTPDANFNGNRTVGVGVSDGNGGSTSTTFSLTVNAVNDAPTLSNPGTQSMDVSDSLSLTLASYGSDVDGDSLTYSATCSTHLLCPISGGALNLSTDASFSGGTVNLTVTDTSSATASVSFTVSLSGSYSLTLSHNGNPVSSGSSIDLQDYAFTLSNNSGQYSISAELDGQVVSDLISVSGSTFTLAMPSSGQFAGTYTLSIYDANASITTTFDLLRPVRLSLNHAALLSGESLYQLDIEGGSAGTVFDLSSSDSIVGFEDALGNSITTASAANNAVTFNRATAWLAVSTATQSSVDLSADSSAYGTISLDNVPVYPALGYSLYLKDATNSALAGSLVLQSSSLLTDLGVELSAESGNGEFSLNLPAGVSISGTASAEGYTDAEFTLDGSNNDVTVTLTESTLPITISGTITGNGGLDFEQEAPLVKITLQGGQQLSVTVDVQSATQASFSKQLDLNSQTPASLTVSHSQTATATLSLSGVTADKEFAISMVKVNSSTSVTVVTTVNAGVKKGGAVLSYLLLCALPLMWRRRKNRQY
ncbi:MAG: tandem-95 repeat protein [Oceanospirillaceae bacterium]|nr:tandem-95 repeat protein [Oceanospirillaceae bacterium]